MGKIQPADVPQAQIDAARAYEDLFVPALFSPFARIVADTAGIKAGQRVLDIACGTGILAREAAERVGRNGQITGLDPHAGMLVVAKRLAPDIDFQQGAAESLPFADRSFDIAVSQFGLMFFNDRVKAIREMQRVTADGGRTVVAVWDAIAHVPAFVAIVELLDRIGGKAAGDALRGPFALGDKQSLAQLFSAAGARHVEVTTHRGTARFPSIREMVEAELRGWLPVAGVNLSEALIARILAEAEQVLAPYRMSDGRFVFDIAAHLVRMSR